MKWIKALLIGIVATFGMDIAMNAMMILGLTPTNIHPAAAFLYNLGIENNQLSVLLHYSYGTLWALVFVSTFEKSFYVIRAIQLSLVLWVFMMLVYSPVIGWGFFGIGNAQLLQSDHPLYLNSTIGYMTISFFAHIAYGVVLGVVSKTLFPDN